MPWNEKLLQYLSVDKDGKPLRTDSGEFNVHTDLHWTQEDYLELPENIKLKYGRA